MLSRRGYNVQSLAVGNCESADLSRITTVIPGSRESSSKVIKQLLKLIHVHSVTDLSDLPFITRELMLIKCRCRPSERKELIDLAEIFHGNICDVSRTTITLEIQGKEQKMRAVQDLLEPYGELWDMLKPDGCSLCNLACLWALYVRPCQAQRPGMSLVTAYDVACTQRPSSCAAAPCCWPNRRCDCTHSLTVVSQLLHMTGWCCRM